MKYTRGAMPLKMLSVSCLFGRGHPSESVILYSAHWALKPSPLIVFTMVTNCSLLALFSSLVSRLCLVTVLHDIKSCGLFDFWSFLLALFCESWSPACLISVEQTVLVVWSGKLGKRRRVIVILTTYCICFEIWSSLVQNKRLPKCGRLILRLVVMKYVQIWENANSQEKKIFRCFVVVAYKDQVLFDTGTDWHSSIEGHITVWRWVSAQKCIAEMGDPKVSLKPGPEPLFF